MHDLLEYHQLALYLLAKEPNIHPGASLSAAAFIFERSKTEKSTKAKIDQRINAWFGEFLFDSAKNSFDSREKPNLNSFIDSIESVVGTLSIVGHDIILASSALKSLHWNNQFSPQKIVDQISERVRKAGSAHPGLFHGYTSEEIRKIEVEFDDFDADSTPLDVATSLVKALRKVQRTYFGFHFQAQETHLITHAEAMISLNKLGYDYIFRKSLKSWFLRLHLLEPIFDLNIPDAVSPKMVHWDPRIADFWEQFESYELNIHPIKTMNSYLTLKDYNLFSCEDVDYLETEKLPYLADSRYPKDWQ